MKLLLGDPLFEHTSIVSCQGVEQLGGLVLGAPGLVPLRLRLVSPLVLKIKITYLIFIFFIFENRTFNLSDTFLCPNFYSDT